MTTKNDVDNARRREVLAEMLELIEQMRTTSSPRKQYELSTKLDEVSKRLPVYQRNGSVQPRPDNGSKQAPA